MSTFDTLRALLGLPMEQPARSNPAIWAGITELGNKHPGDAHIANFVNMVETGDSIEQVLAKADDVVRYSDVPLELAAAYDVRHVFETALATTATR